MGLCGEVIANAAQMGPRYAKRLLAGIPEDRFGRFATPGGSTITANHPAFIVGHLCLYPSKVLQLLGQDVGDAGVPEQYEQLFSKNATCQDDATGELYPGRSELIAAFESGYESAIAAVRSATDEQLSVENPVDSPAREVLPTLGAMIAFYLTGHLMTHLGQLSTWRRMEGMPAA
ncbi:MAG: DinB family protein [Planctomycetales bacterium]|nr:DinB family protein [Planctomycetales bacterium]